MDSKLQLTFLGTGTSVGVPVIGCACPVCTSKDARNQRTRSSIHLQIGELSVLIDAGPDLRQQALREHLTKVDAVFYTHSHLDHVMGFDELRAFCWKREGPLPLHGSSATLEVLRRMFPWAFHPENTYPGYVKPLAIPFEEECSIHYENLKITPLPVVHAQVETHGFLIELPGVPSIAYIPDVKLILPSTIERIQGVDYLIIDALRPRPHATHLSIEEALEAIESVGAGQGWLTHLGHENDHEKLTHSLPEGVQVAYDGLKLFF